MSTMTDREKAIRQKLKDDFEHYAPKCLRIRTKAGDVQHFRLNRSQLYLHQRYGRVARPVLWAAADIFPSTSSSA